jgi:hypothetical protein
MTKTKYYDLQMDDPQDDYDVDVVNANLKKIDEQMKTRENATDALQEPEFTVAAKRENIASKEKMPKILGKIAKFFADLKTVAFSGKYNDLDGKPAIVNNNTTTEPGSALDARQANPNIEGTMAASIAQINSNLNSKFQIINPDGITKNFYYEKSIGNAGGWFRFFKITYFSETGAQGASYNHFNVTISQVFNNGLGGNCNFDIIEEYADNPYIIQRYNTLRQIKKFRIVRSGNIIYFDFYANGIDNTTIVLINIPFYKNASNISEASIVKYLIVPDVSDGEKIIKNTNLTTNN